MPVTGRDQREGARQAAGGPGLGGVLLDQQVGARALGAQHARHHLRGDLPGTRERGEGVQARLEGAGRVAHRTELQGGDVDVVDLAHRRGDPGLQRVEAWREARDRRGVELAVVGTQLLLLDGLVDPQRVGQRVAGGGVECTRRHADGVDVTADPGDVRGRRPQHVVRVAVGHRGLVREVLQRGARPVDVGAGDLPRQHRGLRLGAVQRERRPGRLVGEDEHEQDEETDQHLHGPAQDARPCGRSGRPGVGVADSPVVRFRHSVSSVRQMV